MRFTLFSAFALLGAACVNAANSTTLDDAQRVKAASSTILPLRYIVEFDCAANLQKSNMKRSASTHETVYANLKARGVSFSVNHEFSSDLFFGASISVQDDTDLDNILSTTGVINIHPVQVMSLPGSPVPQLQQQWPAGIKEKNCPTSSSTSASSTGTAPASTVTTCTGNGNKKKCTTSTIASKPTATPSAYPTTGFSVNPLIQVDRVHAAGNKGKGVKIAIIDSGIDYTLPVLGGCFGSNCKIAGGYDFVGDNFNGSNTPQPDNDPYDNCYGHGTFIAGIIGANDNIYNVTGVAPEASLYAYRVFSCSGATTNDIVMQAMMRAYNDGVDIINLSFGEASAWSEDAISVLAQRINGAGTVVVASAGNGGQVGAFYPFAPATGLGPIGTGSMDNANFPAFLATVSTGYGPIPYFDFQQFASGTYGIGAFSTDPSDPTYGCDAAPAGVNLTNKVAIARRGGCAIEQKAYYAAQAGAFALLVVNYPDTAPAYYNTFPVDFAMVNSADGEYLLSQIQQNTNVTLTFAYSPAPQPNTLTGNTTSIFSCIGPTNDLRIGSSVLAPGSSIISTVPVALGNWTIQDGTSFSAPFMTGAAALYINAKGGNNISPQRLREAFEATAKLLPTSRSDNSIVSVASQGAGLFQAFDAIYGDTTISPTELLLNDTANFNGYQWVTIKNTGNSRRQYKVSHVPAGTALTYSNSSSFQPNANPVPQVANSASVRISDTSFTLWAGQTKLILVQFSAPSGLNSLNFPVYSGFIQVSGGASTLQIPYLGVAAAMKNLPIIDGSNTITGFNVPTIFTPQGGPQSGPQTYTFQNGDVPTVFYRLVGGTPAVTIDLVSPNTTLGFTPTYISKRSQIEPAPMHLAGRRLQWDNDNSSSSSKGNSLLDYWCQLTRGKGWGCNSGSYGSSTYAKVPIVGTIYNQNYVARNTDGSDDGGRTVTEWAFSSATFVNGTTVPNGTYKFLMRALKITGDPTKEADYDAWVSAQTFTIAQ